MQGLKPQNLHELETAVLFWAGENPDETLAPLKRLGIRCGQIGLRGDFDLSVCVSMETGAASREFYGHRRLRRVRRRRLYRHPNG